MKKIQTMKTVARMDWGLILCLNTLCLLSYLKLSTVGTRVLESPPDSQTEKHTGGKWQSPTGSKKKTKAY